MQMKSILIFAIIAIIALKSTSAEETSLECTFSFITWTHFGRQYSCTVRSQPNIVRENTTIVAIDRECGTGAIYTNVTIFSAVLRTFRYIPNGLDVLLPNLIGLRFENTQLKHVTKENLKAFPNLKLFTSTLNQIQYIEKDLFIYNTKLELVNLRFNKITYIAPDVFDVVSGSLQQLWIDGTVTVCGFVGSITNAVVQNTIAKLKTSECSNIDNAPALYLYWLEMQQQSSNCAAELESKNNDIDRLNSNITALQADYDKAAAEVATLKTQVDAKDAECDVAKEGIKEEYKRIIGDILACQGSSPPPDCPSLDILLSTYLN